MKSLSLFCQSIKSKLSAYDFFCWLLGLSVVVHASNYGTFFKTHAIRLGIEHWYLPLLAAMGLALTTKKLRLISSASLLVMILALLILSPKEPSTDQQMHLYLQPILFSVYWVFLLCCMQGLLPNFEYKIRGLSWKRFVPQLYLGFVYLDAVIGKLDNAGSWLSGESLQAYLLLSHLRTENPLALALANQLLVCKVLSWLTLIFEASFLFVIISRNQFLLKLNILSLLLFHLVVLLVMEVQFAFPFVLGLYLFFWDHERSAMEA